MMPQRKMRWMAEQALMSELQQQTMQHRFYQLQVRRPVCRPMARYRDRTSRPCCSACRRSSARCCSYPGQSI
jgi:hypothetical protein